MPEYLAPGVYVEEVSSGNKPIAGVSTSTAGFIGGAERGPLAPKFISSWLEYQRWYGGYVPDESFLSYAIEGFFTNGGQRCFVARVAKEGSEYANGSIDSADNGPALTVSAVGPGTWGNRIRIFVSKASQAELAEDGDKKAGWVKVIVQLIRLEDLANISEPTLTVVTTEVFDNLTYETGKGNNLAKTINTSSHLVRVWWAASTPPAPLKTSALNAEQLPSEYTILENGTDGNASELKLGDFTGDENSIASGLPGMPSDLLGRSKGLKGLALIDEISLLIAPDEARSNLGINLTNEVIAQCLSLKDRFAISSSMSGQNTINSLRPPADTSYAAFYYPWIKVYDPSIDHYRTIPASGHVAGIYARTDIERGVHKAPANEVVRGAVDLEFPITKATQDMLNPRGVNCFRDFRSDGRGIRLWGARTMSSDPEWRYVNVRRLFLFVEESIEEGTQWVVFEPNSDPTWASVRRNLTSFLIGVWRSGALMGLSQDEAFFVACDRTTMTQDDIDNGRLVCVIGIAPVKPAEFVIFRISQKTAEIAA